MNTSATGGFLFSAIKVHPGDFVAEANQGRSGRKRKAESGEKAGSGEDKVDEAGSAMTKEDEIETVKDATDGTQAVEPETKKRRGVEEPNIEDGQGITDESELGGVLAPVANAENLAEERIILSQSVGEEDELNI
jgi:hypothetical protein